jgi:hypothetical protein
MHQDFEDYRALRDAEIEASDVRGMVRRLRQIPGSDREKKRELAFFFQSQEGSRFDKDDRSRAYNELLGRERNRRQT